MRKRTRICAEEPDKEQCEGNSTVRDDGDFVWLMMETPADERAEHEDQQLKKVFHAHKPEFSVSLSTGHDFEDMYKGKEKKTWLL